MYIRELNPELIESFECAESTKSKYKGRLRILKRICGNIKLTEIKKLEQLLTNMYKIGTRKNYYALLSKLNQATINNNIVGQKLRKLQKDIILTENKNGHILTESEKQNWISWTTIVNKRKELQSIANRNKIQDTDLLILGLYTLIEPRRNVYNYLEIYNEKEDINNINKNYYDNGTLVLNKYKTYWKYGQQKINCPNELKQIIDAYIAKYKVEKYIIYQDRFTEFVQKITLRLFNKKISCNMFRKIYISYLDNGLEFKMQKTAKAMGHSRKTQQSMYIKKL